MNKTIVTFACVNNGRDAIDRRRATFTDLPLSIAIKMADAQSLLAEEQRDVLVAELQALRESTAAEIAVLCRQHEVERTHLRHDEEQLRGRLLRRLDDGVEMLEVGLSALRNKTPRIEVMMERAEYVVDALRAEMNKLRGE